MKYSDAVQLLIQSRTSYLKHKYQVYNDKYHWQIILGTTDQIGSIYHMDYSENIATSYKFEPQSSHFNKSQYSLHCTVKHNSDGNTYLYHLSDKKKHNQAFTSAVVDHIVNESANGDTILRF